MALGLQEVVERQHAELARMHDTQRSQRAHQNQGFLQVGPSSYLFYKPPPPYKSGILEKATVHLALEKLHRESTCAKEQTCHGYRRKRKKERDNACPEDSVGHPACI